MRLPDVFIADKNDTAKFDGNSANKFALMALAVRRGEGGQLVAIDHVTPAVSNPFVVSASCPGSTATGHLHGHPINVKQALLMVTITKGTTPDTGLTWSALHENSNHWWRGC